MKIDQNKAYGAYIYQGKIYSFIFFEENNNLIVEDFNQKTLISVQFSDDRIKSVNELGFIEDFQIVFPSSQCDCHGTDSLCNHQYDRMQNCAEYDYEECLICADDVCDRS